VYATFILLACPAVALARASWLGLGVPFAACGIFRLLIPREEA
jgi:hypothetical protein